MEILTTKTNGVLIVTLIGRMDAEGAREFEGACSTWDSLPVILDISHLDYISSSGLRALLKIKQESEKNTRKLALIGCHGTIERVFEVSGFAHLFLLYPSISNALDSIAGTGIKITTR
ncbi:MAG: STAS domain-containing protein [Methanoregula sp.]|nr:STAS domain-containing protein [Methanoregula sp.]